MINVVNRKHFKGKGIYIGRPNCLGNPFIIGIHGNRDEVIDKYQSYVEEIYCSGETTLKKPLSIHRQKDIREEIDRIIALSKEEDVNLICWCAPRKCHGDIIKEIVELNS